MAKTAVEEEKPLLAICRGHQILNVALGGSLWEDVLELMPNAQKHAYFSGHARDLVAHDVRICEESRLYNIMGTDNKAVNSIHHQGIKRLGAHLTPIAYAADGLIEGIEIQDHRFAMGIQWHPEEFYGQDKQTLALFEAFVNACQ
jgi:putative glutamine amidotransferase